MFTLYEVMGVFTNLLAGLLGARWGLKWTLVAGLVLQLCGLGMLFGWQDAWDKDTAIIYVTIAQALCGEPPTTGNQPTPYSRFPRLLPACNLFTPV